jgi:ATP-dependent DNA ligase
MLGLYDDAGVLQHVGVCGAFSAARRRALVEELQPYRAEAANHPWSPDAATRGQSSPDAATRGQSSPDAPAIETGRRPGGLTRWNAGKDLSWVALRPELVCEVAYDHMEGGRFRHTTQFRRWRPDREPTSCTYGQLARPVRFALADVLAGGGS